MSGAVLAPLVAGALASAPAGGPAPDVMPVTEVVLLTNEGALLPQVTDGALAVITAAPTPLVEQDGEAGASLGDELAAGVVVEVGPIVPADLGPVVPVPVEALSTAEGGAVLTAEYFAQPDFTEPLTERAEPWIVRDGATPDGAPSVRWSGELTAPAEGRYELSLVATGSSRLAVGDAEVAATAASATEASEATGASEGVTGAGEAPGRAEATDSAPPIAGGQPPGAAVVATEPVGLDLAAGQVVPVVVEHSDPGDQPLAALVWQTPDDIVPAAVAEAVDAAAAADLTVVHVPGAGPLDVPPGEASAAGDLTRQMITDGRVTPERPGRLPVDHTDLVRRLVAANPRTVVVLDATADPSLATWVADAAAVLHVPTGGAGPELLADVLSGRSRPAGVLAAPISPPDLSDDGTGPAPTPPAPLFPEGFGLTYEAVPAPGDGEPTREPTPGEPTEEPTPGEGGPTGEPTPGEGGPTEEPVPAGDAPLNGPTPPGPPADPTTAPPEDDTRPRPEGRRTRPPEDGGIAVRGRIPGQASKGLHITVSTDGAILDNAELLGDRWQLSGRLPTITVIDSRDRTAAAAGWTVSATMSDLVDAGHVVPATSVGWTPTLTDPTEGVTAGPSVAPQLSGGPGLAEPAVLGRAASDARRGTTQLGADLVLETGFDTEPGSYAGTLTVTIFPTEPGD